MSVGRVGWKHGGATLEKKEACSSGQGLYLREEAWSDSTDEVDF